MEGTVVVVVDATVVVVVVVVVVDGVPRTIFATFDNEPEIPGEASVSTALLPEKSVIVPPFNSSDVELL